MSNVIMTWYEPKVDFLLKHPAGPVGLDLRRRAFKVQQAAKLQVGVRTGLLRNSIYISIERTPIGQKAIIGSNLPYAYLHHEGSKRHMIYPVRAKMLRFSTGRGIVYASSVNHPGTRPNRYLSDNLHLAV